MHLLRMLDEAVLGRFKSVRIQIGIWYPPGKGWRLDPAVSGGGALTDLGPHALDLMLQIGGLVSRVTAWTGNLKFDYPVEDFCQARVEFRSGGVGFLETSYCATGYGGMIEVHGEKATFKAEGTLQQSPQHTTILRFGDEAAPHETHASNDHDPYAAAIEDFCDAVRERRAPTVSGRDGVAVLNVIDAIYASAKSGQPVDINVS